MRRKNDGTLRTAEDDSAKAAEAKSLQKLAAPGDVQEAAAGVKLDEQTLRWIAQKFGVRDEKLAAMIVDQAVRTRALWAYGDIGDPFDIAMTMILEMEPRTMTEALLAVQMIGVHQAALARLQRAAISGRERADSDVALAGRLMHLFTEQTEAMARLKGNVGQQSVTVKHVHVNQGGLAFVGPVISVELKLGVGDIGKTRKKTP